MAPLRLLSRLTPVSSLDALVGEGEPVRVLGTCSSTRH